MTTTRSKAEALVAEWHQKICGNEDLLTQLMAIRDECQCSMLHAPCPSCVAPLTIDEILDLGWITENDLVDYSAITRSFCE